jgi:hypothetical protein
MTKNNFDETIAGLEEDYNKCYSTIRKTFEYLEKVGLKEFNKYSKYKWSFDREGRYSYVCIRYGNSLARKSLVKRQSYLENGDLYKWVDNKDLICEALDEAYQYINDRLATIQQKMNEMRESVNVYEDKINDLGKDYDALLAHKEFRDTK